MDFQTLSAAQRDLDPAVDLLQHVKSQLRGHRVIPVGVADGHRQGVHAGLPVEALRVRTSL